MNPKIKAKKSVQKYRKKPIVIEALQYNGSSNLHECMLFIDSGERPAKFNTDNGLVIETLEGNHVCSIGDFIIRGVQNEFYPCKPDIFDATYEEV